MSKNIGFSKSGYLEIIVSWITGITHSPVDYNYNLQVNSRLGWGLFLCGRFQELDFQCY